MTSRYRESYSATMLQPGLAILSAQRRKMSNAAITKLQYCVYSVPYRFSNHMVRINRIITNVSDFYETCAFVSHVYRMITCLTHRYLANSDNNMSVRERSRETSQRDNLQLSEMKMPFSQWELLDQDQLNMMLGLPVDQVQLQFKDILDFKNQQTCVKDAALLDYFVSGFCWAREMNFTCQQISFIMALLQHLLYNIKNNQTSFADHFKVFSEIMNVSSPSAETDTSALFDADQIRSITHYFRISVFQHYRLYEWLFSQQRQKQLFTTEKCIELVNPVDFVSPLEEGMSADVFLQHVAPPCVQTPEQCIQDSHEQNGEEVEREESEEDQTGFSVDDVREMLEETTREMLAQLQADFTEKLKAHEETYTSRLERLQKI